VSPCHCAFVIHLPSPHEQRMTAVAFHFAKPLCGACLNVYNDPDSNRVEDEE